VIIDVRPRPRRLIALLLLAAFGLVACGEQADTGDVRHVSMKLTDSSAGFGLRLADLLLTEPGAGNVFISPLSATLSLSMAASAAQGQTRAAMLTGLGLDPMVDPGAEAKETLQRLVQSDANAELEIAQAVWAQNGLRLSPDYVAQLRADYMAQIDNLDFASPGAPKIVNSWVDKATHHQIPNLVDRFDPGVVAFLVNATYFHASWPTVLTTVRSRPFATFSGASSNVTMMRSEGPLTLVYAPDYQAALLRYRGGRFSFLVVLPRRQLDPAGFAHFLTAAMWSQTFTLLHQARGESVAGTKCEPTSQSQDTGAACEAVLELPRFKLDYEVDMTNQLGEMGMPVPGAEMPGICQGCFLSRVVQKTHLEVDEKGTTASAATGGSVNTSAPLTVVVDHPFAVAIIDNASDAPLFVGVVGQL
jgi:serine protease inhibitor